MREQAAPCGATIPQNQQPVRRVEYPGRHMRVDDILHRTHAAEFWAVEGVDIALFKDLNQQFPVTLRRIPLE